MAKLLINVGNTNITLGIGNDEKVVWWAKFRRNELAEITSQIESMRCVYEIRAVYVATVVPSFDETIDQLLAGLRIPVIRLSHQDIPFDYSLYEATLGLDRLLNAYAASRLYKQPLIIFDLGTATSVQVIKDNRLIGGLIMPGLRMGLESLYKKTDLLPEVTELNADKIIATTTYENMVSGAVFGTVSAIEGVARRMQVELNNEAKVIVTGGNARYVRKWLNEDIVVNDELLLIGILEIGNLKDTRK